MKVLNTIAWVLVIVGGINWGLVGALQFDLVAFLFGGEAAPIARVVYVLVGLAAVYLVVACKSSCCKKSVTIN